MGQVDLAEPALSDQPQRLVSFLQKGPVFPGEVGLLLLPPDSPFLLQLSQLLSLLLHILLRPPDFFPDEG